MGELVILHISFQTKCFLALITFIWAFCTAVFRYEIASIFLCQIELSTEFKDYAGCSEEKNVFIKEAPTCPLSLSQLNGRQTNDSMSENIQLNLFVNLCIHDKSYDKSVEH